MIILRIKTLPYTFNLEYVSEPKLFITDLLTRNIVHRSINDDADITKIVHTVQVSLELLISCEKLKLCQKKIENNEILSKVIKYYKDGWPKDVAKNIMEEIKYYFNNRFKIKV